MPPPGRPMLPSRSWSRAQHPITWGPLVCWVHATAYAQEVVRSRPEFARIVSATFRKVAWGQPVTCSTISGV
jgi:hypothetical protein